MTTIELKRLINEVIKEDSELALTDTNKLVGKSATLEDFMKTLVGKKLKGLLDATSVARLYILNKYGVGGFPDESDVQSNVAELMDNITAFINFRELDRLGKQRDAWDKEQYSKPEYKEWLKQRALAFKAYVTARDNKSPDVYELKDKYQAIASSDPTLPDYRKMMADKGKLVNQFHNTPLTLADVLPGPDDTEEDKKRWRAVEKSFNKLKNMNESKIRSLVKNLIREIISENEGIYPTATVQISTLSGTTVLLYKGNARERDEAVSDVSFKTPAKFNSILNDVRSLKAKEDAGEKISLDRFMTSDRDVISVLLNLDNDELNELQTEKVVVTNNIPNEILDLTGEHIPVEDEPLDEIKPKVKKESGDPFRDIVKKNAHLYRDSELSRMEKERYFQWLQTHSPEELSKMLKILKKSKGK